MHTGTSSTGALLRTSIHTVNALSSNGVSSFETNVKSALADWLEWNPSARGDDMVEKIQTTCSDFSDYLLKAGYLPKKEKIDALKGAAISAVEAFEAKFGDN